MTPWFRSLALFTEDSVYSVQRIWCPAPKRSSLVTVSEGLTPSSGLSRHCTHIVHIHAHIQANSHMHKIKTKLSVLSRKRTEEKSRVGRALT